MRRTPDGFNAPSAEKRRSERKVLDRTEAEAESALERQVAEELPRPLAQVARVRPAHVLAARARTGFLAPPRAGGKAARMAAAKALDCERLHGTIVGP
jgi:hypothetical protein